MKTLNLLIITSGLFTCHALFAQAPPPAFTAANNPLEVDAEEYLAKIQLPAGFKIELYASGLEAARSMALADDGTLYVGSFGPQGGPAVGKVYAIQDKNGDNKGDEVITILEGLNFPNGVALHEGDLYVAELGRILKYENVAANLRSMPEPIVINDELPDDYHHGWKYINIGPDNKLYVPQGAPCNTCEPQGLAGTITRMDLDGKNLEVYAKGVRNSVGFDWHPVTGELWFSDNGRDLLGDNIPPEELNNVTEAGQHFGFPYRYGKDLVDNEFSTTMKDDEFTPASVELPAHNAGLGIEFYTGEQFPDSYENQLFAAYHGSWNRDPIDGYKIRLIRFEDNKPVGFEDFATGWAQDNKYWGRPVDVEQASDGSLLVSDDFNGVVYRISYSE
ncbi:MAG: PQQ-dependent sugar dehydrogenase [Pseudomonadota bacterium]